MTANSQPAEDEQVKGIRERQHNRKTSKWDGHGRSMIKDIDTLLSLLPVRRCQHGLDVKDPCDECAAQVEFEQSLQPAASTPTERATLDALVQMRHHDEHRQFDAATCPAWPCDVIREIRAAASREAQDDD